MIVAPLPRHRAICRMLGATLAFVVGTLLAVRRAHVVAAMDRAGLGPASRLASRMYASLGRGLFELCGLVLFPRRVLSDVRLPDLSAIAPGGAVVATAHTGNWDLVACSVAGQRPLTVVTKHFSVRFVDALWQRLRLARGVRLVSEGRAAAAVVGAALRGELAAMMVDQVPDGVRAQTRTGFLGAEVAVDLSPALLAMRARRPLIVAFSFRDDEGAHGIEIAATFMPPERPSRAWAVATMCEVTRLLEDFVRRRPEQWLWMHRRWRDPRPASRVLHEFSPGGIGAA